MERSNRIFALLIASALTACAVGDNGEGFEGGAITLDGDEQDAAIDDAPAVEDSEPDGGLDPLDGTTPDVPTALDATGSPDRTFIPPDVIMVDGPRLDVPVPTDVPASVDVPLPIDVPASVDVPLPIDVPVVTDTPVGTDVTDVPDVPDSACTSTCAGTCVDHSANNGICGNSAENLGAYCGDNACGFLCPSTSYRTVGTARTGLTSMWFRARAVECSYCPGATILARVTLVSPPGVNYNLFVYRACGTPVGSSTVGAGTTDRVEVRESDSEATSDSFDYFIEVRYVSGASCTPWRLTLEARGNNGSSC